ncbi:MAG: glycosyltransferase [Cryomorphaceae bacterium]|nr:glycosyltransferase [Cryomorphaceae bacterium]
MGVVLVISDYANIVSSRPEAEIFISLHKKGLNLLLMVPEQSPWIPRFKEEGVPLEIYRPGGRKDPQEIAHIRRVIEKENVSLMILFNNRAVVNGIRAAKNHPVKVVVYRGTVGNVYWYDPTSYLKVLHPRVDYLLCLQEGVQAHLDKQMVFVKKKTFLMRKGHKPEWYDHVEAKKRSSFGVPDDSFLLSYVGNVRRFKGVKYLLKATHRLAEKNNIHLMLIGNGFDSEPFVSMIKKSPMSDRIHVLGYQKDALSYVASADVSVLPSLRTEALTKAVQEAMHLGICPVITDIAGNQGLVEDGKSGRVVPIKDSDALAQAIIDCYDDKQKTKRMGEEARTHIRRWLTHERACEMMERFIKAVN